MWKIATESYSRVSFISTDIKYHQLWFGTPKKQLHVPKFVYADVSCMRYFVSKIAQNVLCYGFYVISNIIHPEFPFLTSLTSKTAVRVPPSLRPRGIMNQSSSGHQDFNLEHRDDSERSHSLFCQRLSQSSARCTCAEGPREAHFPKLCPQWGYRIPPAELRRISSTQYFARGAE
jgi:hypothetical protein